MEVKKIVEGMTAQQVAQVIDDNFKAQNAILEEDIATQNSVIGVSEYKDFSEAEAVNVGDVRKYNGFLYECVEATTGAFDASKWKKSSFKNETEKKLSELGSEVDFKFGATYETILESTTLAYNIDIKPRLEDYEVSLLVTSNRVGNAPLYKTTNGVQDDGTPIAIGVETTIKIPSNTTRLRFVRTGLEVGDNFCFSIKEQSQLRDTLENVKTEYIEDNSVFVNTFNVDKGTAFNPTQQIKKAVKWIKLYDYTDEYFKSRQIGLSQCSYVSGELILEIWDYTENRRFTRFLYPIPSDGGIVVLGNKNVKAEVCFDFTGFDFALGGVTAGTSTNDYEHRGINLDKCIKVELQSLRGILLPTASFVKGGFDITRMVSNSIKYLKSLDVNIPIPNIGLSELIYYTSNKMLSVKLWDFTNDVELCKFAEYYDSPKVSDVKISTNGKWEICFDLSEVNFDMYSVTSDNLDSPFTYEARGIDTNCILLPYNLENVWLNSKIEDYTDFPGGVIRKTTNKIEQSSGAWGFLYFPVKANTKYRIIGNAVNVYAAAWAVIAFSSALPTNGGVVSVIKSFETEGYVDFDMNYTPNEDGYLCASYFHSEGLQGTYSVYKFIEQKSIGAYQYPSVYEGISKGLSEFKVGDIIFKGNTTKIAPFVPNAFDKQYEVQYAKYMNNSDGKKYSRMIVQDVVNMFDESLDAEDFKDSYCRQIIGVDSEGWAYIAQRFAMYDFETDDNTKILRTKDFETFETFMDGVAGVQLIELDNGELCFAANSTDTYDGVTGYFCNIYVTSNNKKSINKKFHTTRTSGAVIGQPWSWGIQNRGAVVAISEYGAHGKVGSVWYSRDFGNTFYHVFEHSKYAPNYPNAHIHGICVDPYFDRLYVITGDSGRNSRIYWWDYNRETLNNELWNTIEWKYIETAMDIHSGSSFQFVCGYALKDCVILGSDGQRNGIFRLNRGKKEDIPIIDYGVDFGLAENGQFSTVWCGGNMFKLNDDSPLLICMHREASNDLEPNDPDNPSGYANTYRTVKSKVYATYNGYDFTLLWDDDTYGGYEVLVDGVKVTKTLAKCGRDMSIYQLPNNSLLLKYIGRAFSYVGFNNNGKTDTTKEAYHRFNNYVVRGRLK